MLPTSYPGRILRVNLTTRKAKREFIAEGFVRQYLGGKGIATRLLYDELKPGIDPLSPENKLIFATGPATGTIMPHKGYIVCYKSPLTGIYASSSSGGSFADELKRAGCDILVIEGKSESPQYLWIDDDEVYFRKAESLWGRDTFETNDMIKEELRDEEVKIARIGVAGEKLVRYATINNDYSRMAGRCGAGAVMGSKNLKAIAVRGTKDTEVARIDELLEFLRDFLKIIKETPSTAMSYPTWGTPGAINGANLQGVFPTRYWHKGTLDGYEMINGETIRRTIVVKDKACYTCPVNCSKVVKVREGAYAGTELEGPDYETLYSLGGLVEINDANTIVKANEICDRVGIDTISAGNAVALAMDCYDKRILARKGMDEIELAYGNKEAVLKMLEKIATRDGFGNVLAEGSKRAAGMIGKGAERLVVHVKGLEPAGYDPRGMKGAALGFAVADRGACHMTGSIYTYEIRGSVDRLSYEGKPRLLVDLEDRFAVSDSMVLCRFWRDVTPWNTIVKMLPLLVGFEMEEKEMIEVGKRIVNLTRMFNVREGISRKDDFWPERLYTEPLPDGGSKGQIIDKAEFSKMLDEYYELRGWDQNGIPKEEQLQKIGVEGA